MPGAVRRVRQRVTWISPYAARMAFLEIRT
jgi:hypothetical protein